MTNTIDNDGYLKKAKDIVSRYLGTVTPEHLYIVWFSKTLQNWKALVATDIPSDNYFFEVTYNGDKKETYLDHYVKHVNAVYPDLED